MAGTLIFAGMDFYPAGGILDFYSFGLNVKEDIEFLESLKLDFDWFQIVDQEMLQILAIGKAEDIYSDDGSCLGRRLNWEIK